MNNAIQTELRLFELLPNCLLQTLVHNLSLSASPSMRALLTAQPGFPGALLARDSRSFKNEALKIIGVLEYHGILLGVPEIQAATLAEIFTQQIEACRADVPNQVLQHVSAFYDALAAACRQIRSDSANRPKSGIVSHCVEYIENGVHDPFSLSAMAEALRHNPSYLCRKFKQETGMTPHQYAIQCKMKEAATLLTFTDRSLLDISELLCFSSQSHFQRVFKAFYGVTPRQWRLSPEREPKPARILPRSGSA